jgi:hypothetical protein
MPSVRDNRHVADVEGTSIPMRCWKCEGTLRAERAIDMKRGVSILLYEESTKVCTV